MQNAGNASRSLQWHPERMIDMGEQKEVYTQMSFAGERALFGKSGIKVVDSVFDNGESPLKECREAWSTV